MDNRILDKLNKLEDSLQLINRDIKKIKNDVNSIKDFKEIKTILEKINDIDKRIPKNHEKLLKQIRNKIDEIE